MFRHFVALVIILLAFGILPLAAQTSSLQGIITDPTGAIVPGAVVTITNTETSASRQEVTDETGAYRFLQVLPGPYKVEAQLPGFSTKVSNIVLQVGQPATLNLELAVGQTTDIVNVMAETTTINTQDATVGNPFTEEQIIQLPLQTRNVVALLSLEPGVASSGQVLGARPDQNNVTLDGVNVVVLRSPDRARIRDTCLADRSPSSQKAGPTRFTDRFMNTTATPTSKPMIGSATGQVSRVPL